MASADWETVVIGAGAAGLLGAARLAERGSRTLLLEKNRKPGVKILMSGGTRCNLTHATDRRGIIKAFGAQGKFLHSALAALSPQDLVDLVAAEGVETKVEETGKIFPVSNKATDILQAFLDRLKRSGCEIALDEGLVDIERDGEGFRLLTTRRTLIAAKALVTTGGQSYPGSGTTGDGYRWAAKFGHTIVPPKPALAPITVRSDWVPVLKGITIPDVAVQVIDTEALRSGAKGGGRLAEARGSFLFAHFGLSGPVILDVSRAVSGHPKPASLELVCDFLPNVPASVFDERLRLESVSPNKRLLATVLSEYLSRRLIETFLCLAGLDPDRKAAALSKVDRTALVTTVKGLRLPVTGTLGFKKAEVTAGGVSLSEVDSSTMQSKIVPNLYFAGEVLDLDGPIGGFNFQAAFSTGFLAAERM